MALMVAFFLMAVFLAVLKVCGVLLLGWSVVLIVFGVSAIFLILGANGIG